MLVRFRFRYGLLLLLSLVLASSIVWATPYPSQQRQTFIKAYQAASNGNKHWPALARGLENYPLYPWLEAAYLEKTIEQASPSQIKQYLQTYPRLITARDLRTHYLQHLGKQKKWKRFLAFYRPGLGASLACTALTARIEQGQTLSFSRDLSSLWKSPSLPNSCDGVQVWAHTHGLLTPKRLWRRIESAKRAGYSGTIAALAKWLKGSEQTQAQHLALALRHPEKALTQSLHWKDTPHNRDAITIALQHEARSHYKKADKQWKILKKHFSFSPTQNDRIEAAIALFSGTDFGNDALARLKRLPESAHNESTRTWRVRVALTKQDWKRALDALNALNQTEKQRGQWQYWRARVLEQLGQKQAAKRLYTKQAKQTTFYGFLAADRIQAPYQICATTLSINAVDKQKMQQNMAWQRVRELYATGFLHEARRVWNRAFTTSREKQIAAKLAADIGWHERAIRTFNHGSLMQNYTLRFPLAREKTILAAANKTGINQAWVNAIIRAESIWMPDARSHANARGLMQLLPATARRVAHKAKLPYHGNLYDPDTNIRLGTHYLANMATRYNGKTYLATAAYNAGPGNVDRWMAARASLPVDIFIATIPYHETRTYVMRVMAYSVIYDWRLSGKAYPLTKRLQQAGLNKAKRKSVTCSVSH